MNFINKISLFNRRKRENYNQLNNEKFNHDNNDNNNNTKIDCSLTKLYENVTSVNFTTSSTLSSTSSSNISKKYLPSLTISSPPSPSSLSNSTSTSSISSITSTSSKFLLSSSSSPPQISSITGTDIVSDSRTTKLATPAIEKTINFTTTVRVSQISIENKSFDCENQIKQNENSDENQTSKFSSPLDYLRGGSVDVEEQKEPLQNQDQEFEKQQLELEQEQLNINNVIKTKELDDIIVPDTEAKLDSDEGEELIANDEEIVSPINQQREKELEEDELQQKLQLQNSIHTIILDNTYNDDFDDEDPDDLTVLDMTTTNMENYLNTININKTNSIIQNLNINDNSNSSSNLYDSTTFLPSYLNVTSSLTSSSASSSLSSGIGLDTISSSLQTSNDLFEITLNTSLSINFTTINNLTSQSIGTTSTSISTLSGTATTTGTSTTSINDFNIFLTEQFSWKNLCLLTIFFTLIVITIIGNTLVILAVITTRRLRTVTNCFVMSLAVADLLVGIFVMPPAVAVHILDSWPFSWILCDIYISLDVLLCTASILSLCAISVDRYLAVTQPLTYSRKRRSKRLALIMILIVWLLALAITCPPILGWYEQGRRDLTYCRYNQNEGYVIFSAMGSFFIPMTVMIYVYGRISCVVASRHDNMTDIINNKKSKKTLALDTEAEIDQMSSEQDDKSPGQKKQTAARTLSSQTISRDLNDVIMTSDSDNTGRHLNTKNGSSYELIPTSRTPSFKRQSALCSKHYHQTTQISSLDNKNCASASSEQHQHHHQQQTQQPGKLHWANYGRHSVRMQFVRNTTLILGGGNDSYITRNTRVHHKSLSNRITSLNKENKTTQTLSIVVGGFIVCWLPFFLNYIIAPFLSKEQRYPSLDEFLTWLGWFNSAVNPFIYAFYSVDFRAAFWRLTLKRCYKNSTKNQFPSNTMSIRR